MRKSFLFAVLGSACASTLYAQPRPEYPPYPEVVKEYRQVVSSPDGGSFWKLFVRDKDSELLAELPRQFENQRFFIATTVSGGHPFAGLQEGLEYVYWRRYDRELALMSPNIERKASGDQEAQDSVDRLWTDRVLLTVPIVTFSPAGAPVIDLDGFLASSSRIFFGSASAGANTRLTRIAEAKSFPRNLEIALEWPTSGGSLRTFHWSISAVSSTPGFKPRAADPRVGYFTVDYRDLGKYKADEVPVSYITRWALEKRDPKLKVSPPKNAITFYIEHTVPVRYRRWVKQGVLYWNKAFEQVGIVDAVEVYYQDKATGQHMEKDPEDIRYNFIRWLNNDISTAIGPSRAHPETGEILDADIVLTDGWLRVFWNQYSEYRPEVAMEGLSRETVAWLDNRPTWDPRVRLAPPHRRPEILQDRARRLQNGAHKPHAHDPALINSEAAEILADDLHDSALLCMAADHKSRGMALMGMHLAVEGLLQLEGETPPADAGDVLDGIPEWFVGPMLADLVAHEVGHTLGLRHNFKASSVYTLDQINSEEFKGKKPFTGSVMDYNPVNINMKDGGMQGDWAMIDIGPYDMWAIEYGYTNDDLGKVLSRVSEPELLYGTDEDTGGSDPRARRYDFSQNPMDYGKMLVSLAKHHRERILEKFVKKGQSWARARSGYLLTLNTQMNALSILSSWLGGTFTNRDFKGDPGDRRPIEVVPAGLQREALAFVIENAFRDEAFGLTPELMAYMTVDKSRGFNFADEAWPVHDRILGSQAAVLTMLMNPGSLTAVYDNELRTPGDQDTLTLPEVLDAVYSAVWTELDGTYDEFCSARKPLISSLRRNLQREHLDRLFDLAKPDGGYAAANKPLSNLVCYQLRQLLPRIDQALKAEDRLDPYSRAHLSEAKLRIEKVLDATYIYNAGDLGGGGGGGYIIFGDGE